MVFAFTAFAFNEFAFEAFTPVVSSFGFESFEPAALQSLIDSYPQIDERDGIGGDHMRSRKPNSQGHRLVSRYKHFFYLHHLAPSFAGRIGGIAENQRLRLLLKGPHQLFLIKCEIRRMQRHKDWLCSGEDGVRTIILVEGREYNYFVAGIADSHRGGHHRFRAAAGHAYLGFRVDLKPINRDCFLARASRKLGAPQVTAY